MKRFVHMLPLLLFCTCLTKSAWATPQTNLITNKFLNSWLTSAKKSGEPVPTYEQSLQRMTENQILDEIEYLQIALDELVRANRIESSLAIAASGVLGTMAYGVAHAQLVWLFYPGFYSSNRLSSASWINAILIGVIDSAIPGLAVGALLGAAGYFPESDPSFPLDELAIPGTTAIASTLGLTILGSIFFPIRHPCASWPWKMLASAFISVPVNALGIFTYIALKRQQLHNDHLNLQDRLKEARETLRKRAELNGAGELTSSNQLSLSVKAM